MAGEVRDCEFAGYGEAYAADDGVTTKAVQQLVLRWELGQKYG